MDTATPLMAACEDNDIDRVRFLLSTPDLDINETRTIHGVTYNALHIALSARSHEIARLLIDAGIALDGDSTERLESSLYLACQRRLRDMILFLAHHPRINLGSARYRSEMNCNPLTACCWMEDWDTAMILTNAPNIIGGLEAYRIARDCGQLELCKKILLVLDEDVDFYRADELPDMEGGNELFLEIEAVFRNDRKTAKLMIKGELEEYTAAATFAMVIFFCDNFTTLKSTDDQ